MKSMDTELDGPFSYVPSSFPLPHGMRLVDGDDALSAAVSSRRRRGNSKSRVLARVAWFSRKSKENTCTSPSKHKRKSSKQRKSITNLHQNVSSDSDSSDRELVMDERWLYEEESSNHEESTVKCSFDPAEELSSLVNHNGKGSPSVRVRAAAFGPLVRRLSVCGEPMGTTLSDRPRSKSFGSCPLRVMTADANTLPQLKNKVAEVSVSAGVVSASLPFLPYAVAKESDPFSQRQACHCPACCGCRRSNVELSGKAALLGQQMGIEQRLNSWPRRKDCPLRRQLQLQQLQRKLSPLSGSDKSKRTAESDSGISEIDLSPKHKADIDGNEVKYRMETMLQWFSDFNDQQRNVFLHKMLDLCDCPQLHLLSVIMEDNLHRMCPHNCQDLLSWLPPAIAFRILSFLDPVSLCQASEVSGAWSHMAADPRLWMSLCSMKKWQLSDEGERKHRRDYAVRDGMRWKEMFAERFRVRRNWLRGRYTVRTFEGHSQGISCVQFDEQRIVSGSSDKTIKVWDIRTNKPWSALTLAGHSATVRCLHLSGDRLVSGSADRTIKVWDLTNTGKDWSSAACRVTMIGHMHTVRCLQVDDNKVVSGSYDRTLKVWDLTSGNCRLTLRGHEEAVLCVQFDQKKIVSGSADRTIKIWDLSEGYCLNTLYGHQDAVTCLHFDESRIISGSVDSDLKFWDITTGECVETLDWIRSEGHTGVIRHLQADKWRIISAADDKTLKVWSVDTGQRLLTLRCHTDGVTCLQFNDWMIVSGSYDKTVKLYNFSAC